MTASAEAISQGRSVAGLSEADDRELARVPHDAYHLAPRLSEIASLGAVFVFNAVFGILLPPDNYTIVNLVCPLLLTMTLAFGMRHMLTADSRNIWTALFWFRLSTAAYFGIGVIAVSILDQTTFDYIQSFFPFNDADVFKINSVTSLSVFLVLSTARLVIYLFFDIPRVSALRRGNNRSLLLAGLVFTGIGLGINYTIKIPQDFGWIHVQIPGSILALVRLTMAGIFLLTLWSLRQKGAKLRYILFFLVAIELTFQILRFSKAGILMTLIFLLMAFLWDNLSIKRVLSCALLVIATYVSAVPIVSYGREELVIRYGEGTPVGFAERYDVLRSYFTENADIFRGNTARQSALLRITYVNSAAFVIHQYDIGAAGKWPEMVPAAFIPRFLWPDKPIISDVGVDIYELGTGSRASSMGAGVFADAYWAAGWWGVIMFMPILGAILASLTAICSRLLRQERWLYFPVVLMGLLIGFRSDGHYLVDVVGGAVIVFAQLLLLTLVDWYMTRAEGPKGAMPASKRGSV
jgi:hypothetical protein